MSTPDKNLEISGKRDKSNSNAECESSKKQNSRMARVGNMSNAPSVHVDEQICIPFRVCGICSFGEKCPYLHTRGTGENRESCAITILDGESTDVPSQGIGFEERYLADGKDESRRYSTKKIETRGPKRPVDFRTTLKTKLCTRRRSDGTCVYGAKCTYAHGIAELRSLDSSNPPGSQRSSAPTRNVPARNVASNEALTFAPADRRFKLNDIKRNSRIYGDWIE